eukprot:14936405-Heterocapsa_arctica.AAC.1
MGQQNRAGSQERVVRPRQGLQGQLRRAFSEKQQTHRGLASFIRNDRNVYRCNTNFNDDRSNQYIAKYRRQRGTPPVLKLRQNHHLGLTNNLHLEIFIRNKERGWEQRRRKRREQKEATIMKC